MGNIFSRAYESLRRFTFFRRDQNTGFRRDQADHPEANSPDQSEPATLNQQADTIARPLTTIDNTQNITIREISIAPTGIELLEISLLKSTIVDNDQRESLIVELEATDNQQSQVLPVQDSVIDNVQNEPSTVQTTVTNAAMSAPKCSDFYLACRNNDIKKVKKLLENTSQDEMDQVEPNGSTALHSASYHGHKDVVKLLLEAGADRAIRNKFNYLPFDEARNNEIKELFLRTPSRNPLITNHGEIDWELVEVDALETAIAERNVIKSVYEKTSPEQMFEKIEMNYIGKRLANMEKIEVIKIFFEKARKEKDPIWIIKAYTAETDFYKVLNTEIAGGASQCQCERRYIIALLTYHPKLDHLSYTGTSYRVMKVTGYDLGKYEINKLTMTKSFMSSSTAEEVAAFFLYRQEAAAKSNTQRKRLNKDGNLIKSWVMCKYQIKNRRSALYIENSSQYTAEAEVLIMPYTVFKVKNKKIVSPSYLPDGQMLTIVEFEECDSYTETHVLET